MAELNIFHDTTGESSFLTNRYEGEKLLANNALFTPMRVDKFEIKPSKINKGKECLYAQIYWKNKHTGVYEYRLLITESYTIIEDFKKFDEAINKNNDVGYTKLVKKKDGTYCAASVTELDKRKMKEGI